MCKLSKTVFVISCIILPAIITATPASSFYQRQTGDWATELRGNARLLGIIANNPANSFFYQNEMDSTGGLTGRFLLDISNDDWFAFELNVYNQITYSSLESKGYPSFTTTEKKRSQVFENQYIDNQNADGRIVVDRINVSLYSDYAEITLGRQAVSLATTFYFTPNDFFYPFSAQNFYRIYKSGVDAARVETKLGNLTQLTLLAVLGYKVDSESNNRNSTAMDNDQNSYLVRILSVLTNFEIAVLAGKVFGQNMLGMSLQGELFNWIGIRAEGHQSVLSDRLGWNPLFTIEFDHRYANSLNPKIAWFHNGIGTDKPSEYLKVLQESTTILPYPGKSYLAIGTSYEFSPLLSGDIVAIVNLGDNSWQVSANGIYSVNNETEISLLVSIPFGTESNGLDVKSEFGLYPATAGFELRSYF